MFKYVSRIILFLLCSCLVYKSGLVDIYIIYLYTKVDVCLFLVSYYFDATFFVIHWSNAFFLNVWSIVVAVFFSFVLYYSLLKKSTLLVFLFLCFKSFFIFIIIVAIRIATPRFKIESLTKIGWLYSILFILVCLVVFFMGYFFF